MFRKLALVGMVLLVGRGSVAQLSAAIVLSFGFFALQMYTWPYKLYQVISICSRAKHQTHSSVWARTTCSALPPKFTYSLSSSLRLS